LADVFQGLPLPGRQMERQHRSHRLTNPVVHRDSEAFALRIGFAAAQQQTDLKAEELLEDQAALRGRSECVELAERCIWRREMRGLERLAPTRDTEPTSHRFGQRLGQIRW